MYQLINKVVWWLRILAIRKMRQLGIILMMIGFMFMRPNQLNSAYDQWEDFTPGQHFLVLNILPLPACCYKLFGLNVMCIRKKGMYYSNICVLCAQFASCFITGGS